MTAPLDLAVRPVSEAKGMMMTETPTWPNYPHNDPAVGWEHLKAYGYAPGNYMSQCHRCERVVSGLDKRAITCLPCAQLRHSERDAAFKALKA